MKLLVGCIAAPFLAMAAIAENGPVDIWFAGTASDASDRLAILCADRNSSVVEQDDRHVLCERPVTGVLGLYMFSGRGSTQPMLRVRFSILKDKSAIRVQAVQWVESQSAFGQTRQTSLNSRKDRASLENALIGIGGHNVPPDAIIAPAAPAEPQ